MNHPACLIRLGEVDELGFPNPMIALLSILMLDRRPGDAMGDFFPLRRPSMGVMSPCAVEGAAEDFLCVQRQARLQRYGKVVD